MQLSVVAIDIDGVLCQTSEPLRAPLAAVRGVATHQVAAADVSAVILEHGVEYQEMYDLYVESGGMGRAPVISGACEAMEALSGRYQVKVVTARGCVSSRAAVERNTTRVWLERHGFVFHELHFVVDKPSVTFDLLLDDQPRNVVAARAAGRDAWLFAALYNETSDLPRVCGWQQVCARLGV